MIYVELNISSGNDEAAETRLYQLQVSESSTVLDLLESLRSSHGRAFPAYRHSCHHGSCGTCGALINGVPALMCLSPLDSLQAQAGKLEQNPPAVVPGSSPQSPLRLNLEPLSGFVRIAGLAVAPVDLFENLPSGLDYLMPAEAREREQLPFLAVAEAGSQRDGDRVRFEQCIECGLCQAACPVQEAFIGPAALAAVNRQLQKKPDSAESCLAIAAAGNGAGACQRHLLCSRVCPQAVYPAKHIQLLKNRLGQQPAG